MAVDDTIFVLMDIGDGMRQVAVFDREGNDYSLTTLSTPLGKWKHYLCADIGSSSLGDILCLAFDGGSDSGVLYLFFHRTQDNTWVLRNMGASLLDFDFTAWGLLDFRPMHEGHFCYLAGTVPQIDLCALNIAELPTTFAEAARFLNTEGWALMKNDAFTGKVDLRTDPSPGAELIGSYYCGTPVQTLEDLGDWTKVSAAGVHGYMLKNSWYSGRTC